MGRAKPGRRATATSRNGQSRAYTLAVSGHEEAGPCWRDLLVSESDVKAAKGSWEALTALGAPSPRGEDRRVLSSVKVPAALCFTYFVASPCWSINHGYVASIPGFIRRFHPVDLVSMMLVPLSEPIVPDKSR